MHLLGDQLEAVVVRLGFGTYRPERCVVHEPTPSENLAKLRVGSLFSGYGGLDLAVEEVFNAQTVWFSEINEPVARVFTHHWPDAPNLGDITAIDWNAVPPVDILCGGYPCQDVSTVGKMAGLAPGTRSGLWANMATAVEALQPEWVVIENVRGLLSAPAIRAHSERDDNERHDPRTATLTMQPLARWNPSRGIWETTQLDLFGQRAPCSGTWWTSGMTRSGSAYPLPLSALPIPAIEFSYSPTALFRTPLASDGARGGESLQKVRARRGTIALSHQIIDLALHGPNGYPRPEEPETLWALIGQVFDAGDDTPVPSNDGSTSLADPHQRHTSK